MLLNKRKMKIFIINLFICLVFQTTSYAQTESTSYSDNTNNISGDNTVSIGVNAGTVPNNSVFIGHYAGFNAQSDGNTVIGENAGRNMQGDARK